MDCPKAHATGSSPLAWGNSRVAPLTWRPIGSSPLAWGRCNVTQVVFQAVWFIPTGVGNTPVGHHIRDLRLVHPHWCGETGEFVREIKPSIGSSPQGVGKTPHANGPVQGCSAHPHGREENASVPRLLWGVVGSSPQAWGKRNGLQDAGLFERFIPTGVGNSHW